MEENPQVSDGEPAEVICTNCNGNLHQIEVPRTTPKLFTPKYFVKWTYVCELCNYKSKVFCSKIDKTATQKQ